MYYLKAIFLQPFLRSALFTIEFLKIYFLKNVQGIETINSLPIFKRHLLHDSYIILFIDFSTLEDMIQTIYYLHIYYIFMSKRSLWISELVDRNLYSYYMCGLQKGIGQTIRKSCEEATLKNCIQYMQVVYLQW